MAFIDPQTGTIHATLTYYGSAMGGKTTMLMELSDHAATQGRLVTPFHSRATELARIVHVTILADTTVHACPVHLHLRALAGITLYSRDRVALLHGVDGVAFVADANRDKLGENVRHLREVIRMILDTHQDLRAVPLVLLYNKRDLPDALPCADLDRALRPPPLTWPVVETIAWDHRTRAPRHPPPLGIGVAEGFQQIAMRVCAHLARQPRITLPSDTS